MKLGNTLFYNVPGLRNSGPDHWQSYWESKIDNIKRIEQDNWDFPDKEKWVTRIHATINSLDHSKIVLIGHSVGCMAIVHWLNDYKAKIKGTMLVAPSDVENENYPSYISGFNPIPLKRLACPSIVVASSNDHVISPERAKYFARCWESEFHLLTDAGHIEPSTGFGNWEEGISLLEKLKNG